VKYAEIEATEDLGLGYPPADDTDDLVGAHEKGPGSCANSSEATSSHLTKGENL
jgi:hypothetical protein